MKILSLIMVIIIILNFIFLDSFNNEAIAIAIESGLVIKLFASILAAMGIYLATSSDYINLYNILAESHIGKFIEYEKMVKDLILHRVKLNVKGKYEFIRDFINNLGLSVSSTFQDVQIEQNVKVENFGRIENDEINVSEKPVFTIGNVILKAEAKPNFGYDIYIKNEWMPYEYIAMIGTSRLYLEIEEEIIFEEDGYTFHAIQYRIKYIDDYGNIRDGHGGFITDMTMDPPDIEYEKIYKNLRIKKTTENLDVDGNIGVILDGSLGRTANSVEELIKELNRVETFNDSYVKRLHMENTRERTDIISEDLVVISVPLNEVEDIPSIPGVTNPDIPGNPDIPINPSFPIDTPVTIPDEGVLNEPIPDDSEGVTIFGLGLITRLLKYIANLLKEAIMIPINVIKSGIVAIYEVIKSVPTLLENIIGFIKDIPSYLSEILNSVLTIPNWLQEIFSNTGSLINTITDGITSMLSAVLEIPGVIREGVPQIKEKILEVPGLVVEGIESLFEWTEEKIEKFFKPTKEIDFEPLKLTIIKEKFPFSLPFDLANIISQLNSSPKVPQWNINILNSQITLDFSIFEELAQIIRWAVTILFVIGLIKFYTIFL